MNAIFKFAPVVVVLAMTGCAEFAAPKPNSAYAQPVNVDFIGVNYKAADQLLAGAMPKLAKGSAVIMATVVNIDALESSSTLGRGISEQVTTRFSQAGYNMIELKFRDSVYMRRSEGELMLTREISQVARAHNANAVIVGTYAEAGVTVFVNLKVIDPNSNVVLAATDYALPMSSDVRRLLAKRPQAY